MTGPNLIAVEATRKEFRVLKHEPTGSALDEAGKGLWPEDQFTLRLMGEGAIKRQPEEVAEAAPTIKKG